MNTFDFTQILKGYKKGWVAIDEKEKKVVAQGKDFNEINKKVKEKRNVVLMSTSEDYFGFITVIHKND